MQLSLYRYRGCPFCVRVERLIDTLGVEVELRDILRDDEHRADLVGATGRQTVPVLRIDRADGSAQWMPESGDIAAWLRAEFAA